MYPPLYTGTRRSVFMSTNPFLERLQNHVSSLGTQPVPTYAEHLPGTNPGSIPSSYSSVYGTNRTGWMPPSFSSGTLDVPTSSESRSYGWLWIVLVGALLIGAWLWIAWSERRQNGASAAARESYVPYSSSDFEGSRDELERARMCGELDRIPKDPIWDAWTRP